MMKEVDNMNKKGISLVSLGITIIVLLILLSTISISITYSVANAKKMTFAKEIYNIQSLVTEYIQNEETLPVTAETIQIQPSDLSQFDTKETLINGSLNLDIIDLLELGIKNTSYGNGTIIDKDIYAVSPSTGIVYYIKGFKTKENTYYTLTEELLNMIDKKQNLIVEESLITFEPDVIGWTNEGVYVKVILPKDLVHGLSYNDGLNCTYQDIDDDRWYHINQAKRNQNYTITVNYEKDGEPETATYITKFDNTNPVIYKDETIANTTTHIKGLNATDSESGIKYFKYAEGVIDKEKAKEYIYAYGRDIKKGKLKFINKTEYTLYAEDKAGNYKVMYIDKRGNLVEEIKPPMLVAQDTWYDVNMLAKSEIHYIDIVDKADKTLISSAYASWPAAVDADGDGINDNDIMCYLTRESSGTVDRLTIAGNGMGSIRANPNSNGAFNSFTYCNSITGLDVLDTSDTTNMTGMFGGNKRLTSLNLSTWNTEKVTDMSSMFFNCSTLETLNISNFNTSSLENYAKWSDFIGYCYNLNTLYLGENVGQSYNVGSPGWNDSILGSGSGYTTSPFYLFPYSITSSPDPDVPINIIIYNANSILESRDWSKDNINVVRFY